MSEVTKAKEIKDNDTVAFICLLSGWYDKVPNLHWSAPGDNTHLRLDEVKDFLDETRDAIAEDYQGINGTFKPNEINAIPCDCLDANSFMKEIQVETLQYYDSIPEESIYVGIKSECEVFIHNINKYIYLFTKCNVINLS